MNARQRRRARRAGVTLSPERLAYHRERAAADLAFLATAVDPAEVREAMEALERIVAHCPPLSPASARSAAYLAGAIVRDRRRALPP